MKRSLALGIFLSLISTAQAQTPQLNLFAGSQPLFSQPTGQCGTVQQGAWTCPAQFEYNRFANVSGLRGANGPVAMQVYVQGTSTPNDGGQGNFYWNSTSVAADDNGATTIQPTFANALAPGRWIRLGPPPSNVPTLSGNNTWTGANTWSNTANFTSVFKIAGVTQTFPASGLLVGTTDAQTLASKTLTSPIINTPTLNGSGGLLTLPAGPDTLVARATTDTLTNKTLTAPVLSTIVNTGTLTLPTATDTLVARATTDTLTNKTISGGSNTLTSIANASLANSSITVLGVPIALGASGISPGQVPGVSAGTAASAGNFGEYISANIASGSAIALTTGTPVNVTSISLTAGDWDVQCNSIFTGNAATLLVNAFSSVSQTSATLDGTLDRIAEEPGYNLTAFAYSNNINVLSPIARILLGSTTTVYCVAQASFSTNTASVYGLLRARRTH